MKDLAAKFDEVLAPIFPGMYRFISDSREVTSFLRGENLEADLLCPEKLLPLARAGELKNVVAVITAKENLPIYEIWIELFSNSRTLLLPTLSFDGSLEATIYTLHRLSEANLVQGAMRNRDWLRKISQESAPFLLRGPGCDFTCQFEDEVHLMAPKIEGSLAIGELVSIANFTETGVLAQADDLTPSYDANGTLTVPGVAVAHHRQMADSLVPLAKEAWTFFSELHQDGNFPLKIEVEHSRIVNAVAGKKDILEKLLYFSNPSYELVLTEMAFGTNVGLSNEGIDWTFNSQLNEGAVGIHIAVGEGLTGAHIDLVCPSVTLA